MTFASANRVGIFAVKETIWGTTPTSPAFQELRYTGESVDDSITTEKSQEIRSDRMVSDLIVTDSSPSGALDIEMSSITFDEFIASALMSSFSAQLAIVGVAGDISTLTGSGAANLTSTTAGKFTNIALGQWIQLRGFGTTVSGFYQVIDIISDQALEVFPAPLAATTPAGTAARISGSMCRNGLVEQSYTLMKQFNDVDDVTYHIFRGMRVGGMSLEMSTGSILTGAINFMGSGAEMTETPISGATVVAATTNEVMNCVTNIRNITQDGTAIGSRGSIMSLSMEIDNQHREQKGLGVLGNVGVSAGQLMVNMSATQYFESMSQANKFKNAEAFAFSYQLIDNNGFGYIITLPRCKYETFTANASQLDSDVNAETSFTALRDPVTNCMVQIDRFIVA